MHPRLSVACITAVAIQNFPFSSSHPTKSSISAKLALASSWNAVSPDIYSRLEGLSVSHALRTKSNPPSLYRSTTASEQPVQHRKAGTAGVIMV